MSGRVPSRVRSAGPSGQGRAPDRGLEGPSAAGPGQGHGLASDLGMQGLPRTPPRLEKRRPRGQASRGFQAGRSPARKGVPAPSPMSRAPAAKGPWGGKRRAPPG